MAVTGTPSVQAFSPFNPTSSWSAVTNGGSGYFDGSGDYLSVATSSSAWALGTGDFEIGFWMYANNVSGNKDIVTQQNLSGTPQIFLVNDTLRYNNALVAAVLNATIPITANQWFYCVLSRVSGTTRWFINGNAAGSVSDSNNWTNTSGWWVSSSSQPFNGYISDVRIVKGSGVTSVTVPTAPLTNITNTSLLLNFTNAGIYDATSKNDLETVDGAKISTAISAKWGSGCMAFDGTGDYLFLPSSNILELGSGDYTIEFWLYATSLSGSFSGVIDTRTSAGVSTNGFYIYFSTSQLIFAANGSSIVTYSSFPTGVWKYVAITRSGSATNNTKLFIDGTQQSQGTNTTNFTQTSRFVVGTTYPLTGDYLNGYLQDLRITKGVARTITASPTSAFPIQ